MPPAKDPSRLRIEALEAELSRRGRRDAALLDACHELSEPLTALVNYLEVHRRLVEVGAEIDTIRIAEIIDKMSAQVSRSGQILARLRQLLQGGPAKHQTGADGEAAAHQQPVVRSRIRASAFKVMRLDVDAPPDGEWAVPNSRELRKLAAWYREFAERAGNPVIWEGRLRTADELEAEADRAERETLCERYGPDTD